MMKTELLSADNPRDIERAAELLRSGELVAVPTETVYGLAADASNPSAVEKIFIAKNRPNDHPLITHIHSPNMLSKWAKNIPGWVTGLVAQFWPGPLTLILEKQDHVSDVITGGQSTIGLRMPNQPSLLKLLSTFQLGIAAPSANPYQRLSPTSAEQVLSGLDGKIAAVLDGGPCKVGTESTILAVTESTARILRAGPISLVDLQPWVPVPIESPEVVSEAVSGNKDIHYQPGTPVYLKTSEEILTNNISGDIGLLCFSAATKELVVDHFIHLGGSHVRYRHGLYASLFQLDKHNLSAIWVEQPPLEPAWMDIHDRLQKASTSPRE